jgi:hypothetical protein
MASHHRKQTVAPAKFISASPHGSHLRQVHTHTHDPGSRRDIFSQRRRQAPARVSWGLGLRLPRASCVLGLAWRTVRKRFHTQRPKIKFVLRRECGVSGWLTLGFLSDVIRLHYYTLMQLPTPRSRGCRSSYSGAHGFNHTVEYFRGFHQYLRPRVHKSQTTIFCTSAPNCGSSVWHTNFEMTPRFFRKSVHPYSRLMPISTLKEPTTAFYNIFFKSCIIHWSCYHLTKQHIL